MRGFALGAATRPYPGETANGDTWHVDERGAVCRIAVIDALGHGPDAAEEAARARSALADHPGLSAQDALATCHRALAGGRGAAVSVAEIDGDGLQLTYAGIGNVEGILWTGSSEQRLTADRGIVGSAARTVRPVTVALHPGWMLVVHTDGVSGRFRLQDLLVQTADPQGIANTILAQWGRPQDDATVVVVCASAVDETAS